MSICETNVTFIEAQKSKEKPDFPRFCGEIRLHKYGGEGGTRTLAPEFTQPTPLAGAPRHQLEYYSKLLYVIEY